MGSLPFGGIIAFGGAQEDDGMDLLLDGGSAEVFGAGAGTARKAVGGAKEMKAAMALKSHREAERRRRDRINSHLAKLRSLVPTTAKLEKAALLAEVIERVKELKNSTAEISKRCTLPSDTDELRVEPCGDESAGGSCLIKVSLCCEDRPELLPELKQALRTLQLKTVRAEISTLGGRLKNVFVMSREGCPTTVERHMLRSTVQQVLQGVLDRSAAQVDLLYPLGSTGEKRRRYSPAEPIGCSS